MIRKSLLALALALALSGSVSSQTTQPTTNVSFGNARGCINGDCPVSSFGAVGVNTPLTGTIAAGTRVLTLTTPFAGNNGSYVRALGAGTDQGFAQPAAPVVDVGVETVEQATIPGTPFQITPTNAANKDIEVRDSANGWPYQPNCPTPARYQYCFSGGVYLFNSADAAQWVTLKYLTIGGQTGTTFSQTYQLFAADDNGGYSQGSAITTVTMANLNAPSYDLAVTLPTPGVLTTTNANLIELPPLPSGATKWFACKAGNTYSFNERVWLHLSPAAASVGNGYILDNGLSSPFSNNFPATCPAARQPDSLVTSVSTGAGTTSLTLGTPASSSITNGPVYYDDTNAFQAACNQMIPSAGGPVLGRITVPGGKTYPITSTVKCSATNGARMLGFTLEGRGLGSAVIDWEGPENADVLLINTPYGGRVSGLQITGAPSAAGLRFGTNNGGGSASNITVEQVQVNNAFRYGIEFGRGGDIGQLSEVTLKNISLGGSLVNSFRSWSGLLLDGSNNVNYELINFGCALLGVGNYSAQYNNGSCIWDDLDYFGGGSTGSNALNWFGGSISGSPRYGNVCITCGTLHLPVAGVYNIYGVRWENTGNIFLMRNSGAPQEINFYGAQYAEPIGAGTMGAATNTLYAASTAGAIHSFGGNWTLNPSVNFNNQNSGALTFFNDGFQGKANLQAYFVPVLSQTPSINILQSNAMQGPLKLSSYGTSTYFSAAGTAAPACNATMAHQEICVKDETSACVANNTYASGGSNPCKAQCDGTNWKINGVKCYGS